MNTFSRVHQFVCRIPRGKVTTYGLIAERLGIGGRTVGWALHANKDPFVPCHRVVDRTGRLASSFAFGGPREQRRRLKMEGVKFQDEKHVDLRKFLWFP